MYKEFIPYEQALELKELGFDEECIGHFRGGEVTLEPCLSGWLSELECRKNFEENGEPYFEDGYCSAPTFSQAFRWFREKYGIIHCVGKNIHDYAFSVKSKIHIVEEYDYKTYDEAELACLKKLIEIVKGKEVAICCHTNS